eukprot:COSAG04_NODE_1469_length_6591_cov_5.515404_1_plen_1253_part_00
MTAALAETRRRSGNSYTPLDCAAQCTQPEGAAADGVRLLLAAGADATAKTRNGGGWTALHIAAFEGPDDPPLAGLLMGAGCDPAATVRDYGKGMTALDLAKQYNRPRMASLLKSVKADPKATLAPFRAEVAALRQLVGERGLEVGLAAVAALNLERQADRLGRADEALPEGTRVCVAGRGRGSYVSFERKRVGANEHTIAFDSGETATLKLKNEEWTVKENDMDAMDPPLSITVMTLEQRKIPLELSKFLRTEAVKATIEEKAGVPAARQRLLFNHQPLEDGSTLEQSGVEDGATISLVLRLQPGQAIEVAEPEPEPEPEPQLQRKPKEENQMEEKKAQEQEQREWRSKPSVRLSPIVAVVDTTSETREETHIKLPHGPEKTTVWDLKCLVYQQFKSIPLDTIQLQPLGKPVMESDSSTLDDCGVTEGGTVHLSSKEPEPEPELEPEPGPARPFVYVQGMTAELREPRRVELPLDMQKLTAWDLKCLTYQQVTSYPLDQIQLQLTHKPAMENDSTLAECGVTEGATVHLSVKIRGGGGDEEPGSAVAAAPAGFGATRDDGTNAFVSAFAPPSISPGSRFRLDIWAYVQQQMEHAVAQNRKKGRVQVEQKGPLFLRYGEVKVRLDLPEEAFVCEEAEDSFVWDGEFSNAQFRVSCLSAAPPEEHDCCAQFWVDGKKVSVLYFELAVGGETSPAMTPPNEPALPSQEAAGAQLLTPDSAPQLMQAITQLRDELLVGQQEARDERAQLQQGQHELQKNVDKLSVHVRDGIELLQGGLGDLAQQQSETLRVAAEIQESQSETARKTLEMLSDQSDQLSRLGETTAATFTALKSLSEHENDVPRLVTLTLKDAPEWKGAWHDNIGSNLLSKANNWVGTHQFFQLRFLCEKTLLPVEDEAGYELKMPKEAFADFMAAAGPILSATCAVLKLVTLVGRPVAKIAGIDLPEIGRINMDGVRDIKLGESTVGEAFAGTGVTELLDQIETIGHGEPEPEPEPAGDAPEPEPEPQHGTGLLDFADNAITQVEGLATWAGVPLQEEEEDGEDVHAPHQRLRTSVDTIKAWITKACEEAVPARDSDLGNHVIGGLQKTVMADGSTLWLCPEVARGDVADDPGPDQDADVLAGLELLAAEPEPEPEPELDFEPEPEPDFEPEPEPVLAEGVPTREFLLMVANAENAEYKMLNTTAATFAELRDKVVACWFSTDERRLAQLEDKQWKVSLLDAGKEPTVVERFSQLPAPKQLRGKWKTRAKVQVDKV